MIDKSDILQMAQEAGYDPRFTSELFNIERFAALVAAASVAKEREAVQSDREADKIIIEYHEATIKRLEAGILAEREACAVLAEKEAQYSVATAIRARGQV